MVFKVAASNALGVIVIAGLQAWLSCSISSRHNGSLHGSELWRGYETAVSQRAHILKTLIATVGISQACRRDT